MPHKHVRAKRNGDASHFDLPPEQTAAPLTAIRTESVPKVGKKRRRKDVDDTPRKFTRLLQWGKAGRAPSGLDDGNPKRKAAKGSKPVPEHASRKQSEIESWENGLRPMAGEKLSDFSARVNQAMPITGLVKKGGGDEGIPGRQTRLEKRLHKRYAEWRVEEEKIREREEEAADAAMLEEEEVWGVNAGSDDVEAEGSRKRRRKPDTKDVDPWARLKDAREQPKGINDVAQAPPTFRKTPTAKFKNHNGAFVDVSNVPTTAGSLKRREELGASRNEVIARYRSLMKGSKRARITSIE